jgi:hypothetical protein
MGALCTLLQLLQVINIQVLPKADGSIIQVSYTKYGYAFIKIYKGYAVRGTLNDLNKIFEDS